MKKFLFSLIFLFFSNFANAKWLIELENTDIKVVTREISNITKKNFIVSDNLDKKITMNIRTPVSDDELYDYFLNALRIHNMRAIENGSFVQIVSDFGGSDVIKLNHASANNVAEIINSLNFDGVKVVADIANNSIIINSNSSNNVRDLVAKLDVKRQQVLIRAVIVEVSSDDINQLGVQWSFGSNSNYGVVNLNPKLSLSSVISKNPSLSVLGSLISFSKKSDSNFYGAVLNALDKTTNANLLSMPSILALDNEQATILVGQNVPFVTGSYSKDDGREFQTIERQDVGITLKVKPQISNNHIKLKVYQEVSSVVNTQNLNGVITNKNVIDTIVSTKNEQTIVLGGLIRDDVISDQQSVPYFSKIKVLGNAFKSKHDIKKKSNLLIFLQPTIINENDSVVPKITDYQSEKIFKLFIKDGKIEKVQQ